MIINLDTLEIMYRQSVPYIEYANYVEAIEYVPEIPEVPNPLLKKETIYITKQ
jgi:hypothetical protein